MYYVKACSVTPTAGKVTHGRPAGFVTDRWRTGWGATLRLATLDTETRLRAFVRHFPTRGAVSSAVKKLELGTGESKSTPAPIRHVTRASTSLKRYVSVKCLIA